MEKYKPVSCNLYDELSNAIVLKKQITIVTTGGTSVTGLLKDIFTKDKEEFCAFDDVTIRLDHIATLSYENGEVSIVSHWSCATND
jgi:transcriptional antiterminator Rof (Rho-off)